MKEQILNIIELANEGKVTPEQAAELIAALNTKETKEEKKKNTIEFEGLGEFVSKAIQSALNGELGKMRGKMGQGKFKFNFNSSDSQSGNEIHNSHVVNPDGQDYEFDENEIHMSSLKGLHFEHSSEFNKNALHASNINRFLLSTSEFNANEVHGSSLEEIDLDNSSIEDSEFHGSKASGIKLEKNSKLEKNEFHGSNLKNLSFNDNCLIKSCEFHGCHLANLELSKIQWKNGEFHDCHFSNCRISNVNLENFEYSNLTLKDATIDGNDEFIKIFGN